MPAERLDIPVTGTSWRPSFLRLFVISRNNFNPRVTVTPDGLEFTVVQTTQLDWAGFTQVDVRDGLGGTYAVVSHGGGDYIAHFREPSGLRVLLGSLTLHGAPLTQAAERFMTESG